MTRESGGFTPEQVDRMEAALEEAWLARGYGQGNQWRYLALTALENSGLPELLNELRDWRSELIPGTYADTRIVRIIAKSGGEA